jgi:hypothetical protein
VKSDCWDDKENEAYCLSEWIRNHKDNDYCIKESSEAEEETVQKNDSSFEFESIEQGPSHVAVLLLEDEDSISISSYIFKHPNHKNEDNKKTENRCQESKNLHVVAELCQAEIEESDYRELKKELKEQSDEKVESVFLILAREVFQEEVVEFLFDGLLLFWLRFF